MKSANWISAIGRMPAIAAPTAIPTIDASASGVSMTRSRPNSSKNPAVMRKTFPRGPMSSPMMKTRESLVISACIASRTPSNTVFIAIAVLCERAGGIHVGVQIRFRRRRLRFRPVRRLVHLGLGLALDLGDGAVVDQSAVFQPRLETRNRILFFERFDLFRGAIRQLVVVACVRHRAMALRLD